jgi:hypothetical protein
MSIRTYTELTKFELFEERYRYLRLGGRVGVETFGIDRWLNQNFYQKDTEWLEVRDFVIIRDAGCDLAMPDRRIEERILVHHMNPITREDIIRRTKWLLDPEYLICTIKGTHDAIHYGDESKLIITPPERQPFDTCPWRR